MFKQMIDLANSFRVAATNSSLHSDGVVAYNFCADSIEQLAQLAPENIESPPDSPALPVQHGQHAICAMRFDTCCYSVDNVCSTGCSYGGVCPHKQHA